MTTPAPCNPTRTAPTPAADERRPDWFDSMRTWWEGAEGPPPQQQPAPAAEAPAPSGPSSSASSPSSPAPPR